MTVLIFHHNHQLLPAVSAGVLPVQLYGLSGRGRGDVSVIGNPVLDKIKRLGVKIPAQAMDFMTIALAVTAADTFVRRSDSDDGWTRQFNIQLPLHEPSRWRLLKKDLERALHFLSGDMWDFDFCDGGHPPPEPYRYRDRFHLVRLRGLDCACLFSGGLDSAIGAIDLLTQKRAPLLVSHAYKGDKAHQDLIAQHLKGRHSRFEINADPHLYTGETDITMRTRSLNFLAFAAVGACAVKAVNRIEKIDLFVPENGFISLNAPLTPRRIGTLSTRTTHPHFLASIQLLLEEANIPCNIVNPYQFRTKGQMVAECKDNTLLSNIVDGTVSCSHWKRANEQCGICVPCIIRRAALHSGGMGEHTNYSFNRIVDVLGETDRRDDLMALGIAVSQKSKRNIAHWISDTGPLPEEDFDRFKKVFIDGLNEVERFLNAEGAF
jgi:hypothetical protein